MRVKRFPQDPIHESVKRLPNVVGEKGAAVYGCREKVAADKISKRGEWNLIGYSFPCGRDLDGCQRSFLNEFWTFNVAVFGDVYAKALGGLHARDVFAVYHESERGSSVVMSFGPGFRLTHWTVTHPTACGWCTARLEHTPRLIPSGYL